MHPTQTQHPWRATLRTVLAVVVALAPVLPQIVDELGLSGYGWAAAVVAVAGAVTRVLAVPAVNDVLSRWLPLLSAAPKDQSQP
ncbi:MAG: hypothetical protein IRY85_14915 [Micromonosporaceae bacterium]|nr:hypothetical protein [Micromonosporaceae bacterium]